MFDKFHIWVVTYTECLRRGHSVEQSAKLAREGVQEFLNSFDSDESSDIAWSNENISEDQLRK